VSSSVPFPSDPADRLGSVLADVVSRRAHGELVAEDSVVSAHPELMPALGERLRVLRLIQEAERSAHAHPISGCSDQEAPDLPGPEPTIPGYDIVRPIHRGGQGAVYEAVQRSTGRTVAVKVLPGTHFADARHRDRFDREVKALSSLRHPNIAAIHDSGSRPGFGYIVMDYVDGQPLDVLIAEDPRPAPNRVLELFATICDAVNAAHLRGIIHRDLKPSNILIDAQGRPYVLDFGLAKLVGRDAPETGGEPLTTTGQFVGTLPWASPEQVEGLRDQIDLRTDVYSLGVILFQLLTGTFPYAVDGRTSEAMQNVLHAQPQRPSALHRQVPRDVDTIVLKCLAKERERRYQTAGEIARDVNHQLHGEPLDAKRDSSLYVLRKTLAKHWLPTIIVVAFVTLAVVSALTLSMLYSRQSRLLHDITAAHTAEVAARRSADRVQETLRGLLLKVAEVGRGSDIALRRALLDEATRGVDMQLGDEPAALAAAHEAIGQTYQNIGLYTEAEQHLRRALAIRVELFGGDHAIVAASLNSLGLLLLDKSAFAEAQPLLEEALAIRQRACADDPTAVAESLDHLGLARQYRQRYEEAAALHREALAIHQEIGGNDRPEFATCLSHLAMALFNEEQYAAAEPVFRQTLEMRQRLLGEGHRDVAGSKIALAKFLHVKGDYAAAEPLYREAIETYRTLLGDSHDNVAWGLHRLGNLLHSRGRYIEARSALEESLSIYRRCLGNDDPYAAMVRDSLGTLLLDMGSYGAAEPYFLEALHIRQAKAVSEQDDPWRLNRIGELRQLQGDHTAAEPLLRAALENRAGQASVEFVYLVRALRSLATLLMDQGEFREAEALCQEIIDLRLGQFGEEHPDSANAFVLLARARQGQGDYATAEQLTRRGLEQQIRFLGDEHPLVARTLYQLAQLEAHAGQREQAESTLIRAIEICDRTLPAEHPLRSALLRAREGDFDN